MAHPGTERRLAAILAADLVGYSRLIRADEDGTLAAFKALRPARGTGLYDVAVDLCDPYSAATGRATVTYQGKAAARADALGVEGVDAGWEYADGFVLAWTVARGGKLG